jgi:hypothetical protein
VNVTLSDNFSPTPDLNRKEAMRITLAISSDDIGGAQRVMALRANYWAAEGRHVTLVSVGPQFKDRFALHHLVKRASLNLWSDSAHLGQALYHNALRVLRLRDRRCVSLS